MLDLSRLPRCQKVLCHTSTACGRAAVGGPAAINAWCGYVGRAVEMQCRDAGKEDLLQQHRFVHPVIAD